ncbi:OmpH family outer membrane protein [Desulfurispira natronophila]|uniref:Outer membrane protein n=1 Tax=Desulfurispira natronophila TaxID=682562 RepID=A0A7W7Y407_9BACT|nr:OmpH family outer membrane protein [Desulfurispira natronophila]MBB5021673.1 outer membrane protein [Desulfurispira natronophila]
MKYCYHITLTATIFLLLTIAPSLQAKPCQYGYIDVQRAIDISSSGQQAIDLVKQDFDQKRQVIEERKDALARQKKELDRQQGNLSQPERQSAIEAYNMELASLRRFVEDANRQLEAQERSLTNRIVSEIGDVVRRYGEENNYCYIFELKNSGILYANQGHDITRTIVDIYDRISRQGRNETQ